MLVCVRYALLDVGGNQLGLFRVQNLHLAGAVVIALWDGDGSVHRGDGQGDCAVVGHGAGELCAPGVGGLALDNFRNLDSCVTGIHVKLAGVGDGCAGLVVGGEAGKNLVRGHGVGGQVNQDGIAEDDLVSVCLGVPFCSLIQTATTLAIVFPPYILSSYWEYKNSIS